MLWLARHHRGWVVIGLVTPCLKEIVCGVVLGRPLVLTVELSALGSLEERHGSLSQHLLELHLRLSINLVTLSLLRGVVVACSRVEPHA